MATLLPRAQPFVCRACQQALPSRVLARFYATAERPRSLRNQLRSTERRDRPGPPRSSSNPVPSKPPQNPSPVHPGSSSNQHVRHPNPVPHKERSLEVPKPPTAVQEPPQHNAASQAMIMGAYNALKGVQTEILDILDGQTIPEEKTIKNVLLNAQHAAAAILQTPSEGVRPKQHLIEAKSDSLLVDLDEKDSTQGTVSIPFNREDASHDLAKSLYVFLEDPKVFISESILGLYVDTITDLSAPQYLPKVFALYATKPVPKPNTSPVQYSKPWANMPKYAIPKPLADKALEAAIAVRDLPLAISLIETTYGTTAYRAGRFVRHGMLPVSAFLGMFPLMGGLASWATANQVTWEPSTYWWTCVVGGTAYVGTMGTLLYITVTTWNDHHKRIRWIPGTHLWTRWAREDERAAFDRIACAWGFQNENKHGEETGEEWEALREEAALRWMELDRAELLPGMY